MDNVEMYKSVSPNSSEVKKESPKAANSSNSRNRTQPRHPRQKYCFSWENEFPWLKASKIDESLGFCTICEKRLVCKKSHLERHEQSFKHQRLQNEHASQDDIPIQGEIIEETVDEQALPSSTEFMECTNKCDVDEMEFGQAAVVEENYVYSQQIKANNNESYHNQDTKQLNYHDVHKLSRLKLLKRVDRDRQDLNNYYNARMRPRSPINAPQNAQPPPPQRDRTELFFDSVCAGVKALPPKLAAEAINRISQVMTEFDLRAICEREALENSAAAAGTPVVLASSEVIPEVAHGSIDGMPRIVYTIQPKLQ